VSTHAHRAGHLQRLRELAGEIRRANRDDDFDLATRLNEHLGRLLSESPEHLLKTRELADWRFSATGKAHGDELAADAIEELEAAALALGPSPSWH
jgi:hypothetical protein